MAKTKQFLETAQSFYEGAIRPTGKRIADWQPSRASTGGESPSKRLARARRRNEEQLALKLN